MNVKDAVLLRTSVRQFLKNPVPNSLLKQLLQDASRSPSGGNLQPWKLFVINNDAMKKFLEFQKEWKQPEMPA
jgi:nitroreductase